MMTVTPLPHTEATARIAAKPAVTRAIWDRLHPDLQARAFTIAGVEALDVLARVRDLTATLPSGGDYDELKSQILSEISPWLVDPNADDETQTKQRNAARRRAELLLRLHGWQAYAQTHYELAEAHKDIYPFRQYLSSEDNRVRPSHAALNKKVLPSDHPFWLNHTPPWEFNCRCDMVVLTQEDAEAMDKADAKSTPEDRRVLPPAQLREIEKNNRIVKPGGTGFLDLQTPREKGGGKGYEFRPATNALPLDQILERFTPSEKAIFEHWAKSVKLTGSQTLAEWWKLKNAQAGKPAPATPAAATAGTPLKDKLAPNPGIKPIITTTLSAIDRVHTDGPLPIIPVHGAPSPKHLGHYHPGKGKHEIAVRKKGPWPHLTAAHEVGHFIDHLGIGKPYSYESETPNGKLSKVISAIQDSAAYKRIATECPSKHRDYMRSPRELWARAYAQYIATQSADADLLAGLNKSRSTTSFAQWADDDFAPIAQEITAALKAEGWLINNKNTP